MFCQNCGKEITNNTNACPYCGANVRQLTGTYGQQVNPTVNQGNRACYSTSTYPSGDFMMSKDDYLALSQDYQQEKEILRKKGRNKLIIGMILMVIGILVAPFILIPITFDSGMSGLAVFGICMLIVLVGVVTAATGHLGTKRKIKDSGVRYYQQYASGQSLHCGN